MHRDQSPWIGIAERLHPRLVGLGRSEQRRLYREVADGLGRKPATLERMVRAYQYALRHAKACVSDISEVLAPVVCLEVLERLERKAPELAAELTCEVMRGEVSFRRLLRIERQASVGRDVWKPGSNWDAFAIEVLTDLYGAVGWSSAFNAERQGYSEMGKLLKVDWEVDLDDGRSIAIFLSPQIIYSAGGGKPVEQRLALAFMAMSFYDEVGFLAADAEERTAIEFYVGRARHPERMSLVVWGFEELRSAAAFDAFQAPGSTEG